MTACGVISLSTTYIIIKILIYWMHLCIVFILNLDNEQKDI